MVAYSDRAKRELLDVPGELLERHGAVSPQVAEAMADGALARFHADLAVGITGIAGPDGGTEEKPVGYVCICVKSADGAEIARDPVLPGNRAEIRDRSTTLAHAPDAPAAAGRGLSALSPCRGAKMKPEPYEIGVDQSVLDDLRVPAWSGPGGRTNPRTRDGSSASTSATCARCATTGPHAYDWRRLETRLNELDNHRWEGIHFIRRRGGGEGLPVLLVHGWPGGPIEFLDAMPLLVEAGHDVVVPSLPGYAWSDDPGCAAQRRRDVACACAR